MKIEDIGTWEAFHGVAKQGSFSGAARVLGVTVPQVSKRVARLEESLGVRLFQRSTRVVSLTDEGKTLLPKVAAMLEDLAGIEASFEDKGSLSGTVRISSIAFVAHRLLVPVFAEFRKTHPQIKLEIELSANVINLIEENVDIAIRIHSAPTDSDLVYRRLASNDLIFCASPAYLKSATAPLTKPSDLHKHPLLMLPMHRDCAFQDGKYRLRDFEDAKALECEDGPFLTELAQRDFGVLVRSVWDVQDLLKKGKLVQVLKKHALQPFGNIYAVIPSRRLLAPRVRVLLDLVVKRAEAWR